MGGRSNGVGFVGCRRVLFRALMAVACGIVALAAISSSALAQQRREREPNSAYAARRAKLAAETDAPIVLWGYTGREEFSEAAVFAQEEDFYYLTGHNEEDAALVIFPASKSASGGSAASDGKSEILFLPPKDTAKEKWNGVRLSPTDPGIEARTGFASVQPISELAATLQKIATTSGQVYTVLPYETEMGGYPHEKDEMEWLDKNVPGLKRADVREKIAAMRQIKSPGELLFLKRAVEISDDAHLEAMKMMRPGLYEYQIAAKMVEVHLMGGSEAEGYSPIVGAGPNSTALHYDKLSRKIEDGDIVVLDVGAQYSGYSADITRTLPANGKFTPRQREIYEIVLGAQNAAIAAAKPGSQLCRAGKNSLFKIAYEYINTHGKDKQGKPLGQYFIHGLSHHIGLNVHDVGDSCRPLEPGMVFTIEPGIYIPDENLGVRIEDDALVTETGIKLLSEKLPRNPDEIEKIMAEAAKKRTEGKKGDD
jgi:Xaa-Pro aminopeptidase